ncbi:hypothetical protein O181_107946 [Austropuccinia psidii MF-1]|uniref:Uncharacterized protein n=1 Tax=Austropuccinia psidii MF-1 TaxID=1389203 RepID=A0A9Q3JTV2_9BASI|nr:hypothetical protein [Austropuccinia psidii MF-1]
MFADNPTVHNHTTVERLVEETCPSCPTPVFNKKRKAKKLVFPGATVQDSEEDPKNSSNQMGVEPEVEMIPKKGKIPNGTESTQRSAISQREMSEMAIISGAELELRMINSKGNKSHSEGSDRHLYEPVQELSHNVQGLILGNAAINSQMSYELLAYLKKVQKRGDKYLNIPMDGIHYHSNPKKKIKDWHNKKKEARKEEALVSSTRNPQASKTPQKGNKNKKKSWGEKYSQSCRIPRIQKDSMENVFKMSRTLWDSSTKMSKE